MIFGGFCRRLAPVAHDGPADTLEKGPGYHVYSQATIVPDHGPSSLLEGIYP